MSHSGSMRTEPATILGLGPLPTATKPLDAGALALEHVLPSLARVEARVEATDRRVASFIPLQRPDPEPPSSGGSQPPIYTQAIGVSHSSLSQPMFSEALMGISQGYTQPITQQWGNLGSDTSGTWQPPPPSGVGFSTAMTQSSWDPPRAGLGGPLALQPTSWDNPAARQNYGQHFDPQRQFKMQQPRFDGSERNRLHYVVMLFDPPASEWVFNYRANNPQARWSVFLEDVRRRFDPQYFQNFIGLIAKLCQTGSLAEYHTAFEMMLNRVRGVPEFVLLPVYIEGLQQPVKNKVKHQNPPSVAAAMALAIEYDSCLEKPPVTSGFKNRNWQNRENRPQQQHSQLPSATPFFQPNRAAAQKVSEYSKLPVVRISAAERAERTRLGLCWWCPKKWVPGHS